MTVKQLIYCLMELPMDKEIEIGVLTNGEGVYAKDIIGSVEYDDGSIALVGNTD